MAHALAYESLRLKQETPQIWLSTEALLVQAYSCYFQGEYAQAYTIGKKAFKLSHQTGELYLMIRAAHAHALFAHSQKNTLEVKAVYEEVIHMTEAAIATAPLSFIAVCLVGLGAIAVLFKQYIRAVHLWSKAKSLYKRRDGLSELEPRKWLTIILGTHLFYSQAVEVVYTQLDEDAFMTAWNEGLYMQLERLLEEPAKMPRHVPALEKEKGTVAHSDELTTREKEVLRLLAQGLSSALIAEQLVISLVTVNTHIRAIYSKLGVSSRSAATRLALERHLV
jgi:ATP/maltotriose-dependent transcriptional regulator MalT